MKRKSVGKAKPKVVTTKSPVGFVDRQLIGVSPLKEQFEPSGAQPIRQHHKMAGMS